MKCFALGFIGVIAGSFLFVIGLTQYSDYIAEAQVGIWCLQLKEKTKEIEQLAQNEKQLFEVSRKVSPQVFSEQSKVRKHRIYDSGAIVVQGGKAGQMLLLEPQFTGSGVEWDVYVGPAKLIPGNCRSLSTHGSAQ